MKKIFIIIGVLVLVVIGFVIYKNTDLGKMIVSKFETKQVTSKPNPPIFDKLAVWVPNATWGKPEKAVELTPYGKTNGLRMTGEIRGKNVSISRNFEDQQVMNDLGYFEDINFAADGPGSSNWGYSKTENGKTSVVVFRYSTNALLGPENQDPPFVNLSVYISNSFVRE